MLVAAGALGACAPARTPADFGSVPEAAVVRPAPTGSRPPVVRGVGPRRSTAVPRTITRTTRPTRRAAVRRPAVVTPVAVPAGAVAPLRVSLPGRGTAPVTPAGVTDDRMDIPGTVTTLGWWVGGAALNSPAGSVVLAGHVDSATQGRGYLASLRDVAAGERIAVQGSDGRERHYYVTGRRTYHKDQGLPEAVFSQTVQSRLVLITCTGAFSRASGRYEDNLVVYAVLGP